MAEPSRVALVTGAGRGIGQALAIGLAERGLAVGLLGRHADTLTDTAESCRAVGARAHVVTADVTDDSAIHVAVAEVGDALGPIDLLVNNAGRIDAAEVPLVEADLADVIGVLEVTFLGVLRMTRAVLPGMVRRGGGRILTVNSGFADRRSPTYTGYALAKAGAARLTDLVAAQGAPHGVVTLDVSPGVVRTAMTEGMPMWASQHDPQWGDAGAVVEVARAFAAGGLDALSGRFVHATTDDVAALAGQADRVVDADARRLRLAPYGPDDPVAG